VKKKTAAKKDRAKPAARVRRWLLLVYRVPSDPSRNRVSVWRELKRRGALFLQSCVCVLPDRPECRVGIEAAIEKVQAAEGRHFLFPLTRVDREQNEKLVSAFRALSAKEYEEILEECETKFVREVEFERGRENYTYEEAEEIREDFEKIERWLRRVEARDWFEAGPREAVRRELARCERLLESFEEEVYGRAGTDPGVHD